MVPATLSVTWMIKWVIRTFAEIDSAAIPFWPQTFILLNIHGYPSNSIAGSHLTLGVLYAQAGLLDDAERELQLLLRANPQSALAQKLLRGVRAKRRS